MSNLIGPDGEGCSISGPIGLGNRRLAVIDLSLVGKQPMSNEDRTFWVTFNGEIYNFLEIRKQLQKRGHTFCSTTHTEVIVHAYEEWAAECRKLFNGMFAFGLWDANQQHLLLARDRLGVKALFYTHLAHLLLLGRKWKRLSATLMCHTP